MCGVILHWLGTVWEEIVIYPDPLYRIGGRWLFRDLFYCSNGDAIGTSVSACDVAEVCSSGVVIQ